MGGSGEAAGQLRPARPDARIWECEHSVEGVYWLAADRLADTLRFTDSQKEAAMLIATPPVVVMLLLAHFEAVVPSPGLAASLI